MTESVVLITGASSGIGRACAEHLASRGYRVYGTSRSAQGETIAGAGGYSYKMVPMDVTDTGSVERAVAAIVEEAGRIDAAVNNAGIGISGPVEGTSLEEAKRQFEVNFFGVVRVCQAVLPLMRAQGGGHIVNMSSIGGLIAQPFQAYYCASKFAIEGFSEALRIEVAPCGIKVSLIEPGDFSTGFTASRAYAACISDGESPYAEAFRRVMDVIEHDENTGSKPEMVGPLLDRILLSRSPRLRYRVGAIFQRFAAAAKPLLPPALFEWALSKVYHMS